MTSLRYAHANSDSGAWSKTRAAQGRAQREAQEIKEVKGSGDTGER